MKPTSDQDQPLNPLIEARRRHAQKPRRRGLRWRIAAGVVVFLILFGFFGLPPIVRSQAIKHLSAALNGRPVAIEKIRINPLVLSVSIEGFAIGNPDGTPFVGWKRVYVNFDSFSVFTGQWRFQKVEIDGFSADVAIDKAGVPNFQDLIPAPSAEPAKPAEPSSPPRPVYVEQLVVAAARLGFTDQSKAKPFATTFGPIGFSLNRFNTSGDARAPYQFEAVTEKGERFAWSGTVSLDPMRSQGEFEVTGIDLAKYAPYHQQFHNADIRQGLFDIAGAYGVDLSGEKPMATFTDGKLAVRDFSLAVRDAEQPLLEFKRFAITGISADLAANTARVERIALDGAKARLEREADGSINALRLLPKPAAAATPAASAPVATSPAPALPLPDFTLGEFAVTGLAVELDDLATPRKARTVIDSIDLSVRDFALLHLDRKLPLSLAVHFGSGGDVKVAGEVSAQPLSAALQLGVNGFELAPFSPYVEPFVNIRLAGGAARAEGSVLLQGDALTFTGAAGLDQLKVLDPVQAESLLAWTSLALNGIRFQSQPLALHLDEIVATDPAANVLINSEGAINLTAALAPAGAAAPAPGKDAAPATAPASAATPVAAAPAAPLPDISVDRVELRSAKFGYEDRSVKPAARTGVLLNGTITGLSSAQLARADVNLTGTVDGTAPIAIIGKLNPLGQPAYSKLTLDFKSIELPAPAGPYIGKFAGYELARGRLSLDINFNLNDRKIDSSNVVTIDQFTFGPKTNSPDATKLPVGLAVALLKDSSGKIVIDMPIKGSLDDPKFKIGHVVLRVITNILVKAATSPFSLLGAAFGGGGDELAYQLLAPGAIEPSAEEAKKLETVAKALVSRPALQLDIQGSYDAGADRESLRSARLDKQIRARVWEELRAVNPDQPAPDELTITPEQTAKVLLELYTEAFPPKEGAVAPVMSAPSGELINVAPAPATDSVAATRSAPVRRGPRTGTYVRGAGSYANSSSVKQQPAAPVTVLPVPEGTPGAPSELMTNQGVPVLTPELAAAKLAAAIEITEDDLRALADARAQAVRGWMIGPGQVPAERVFTIAAGAKGSRVDFNLR